MNVPTRTARRLVAAVTALVAGLGLPALAANASSVPPKAAEAPAAPLTNLDHLNWLGVKVQPPAQRRHTTYRLGVMPRIGTLWTYAEPDSPGGSSYHHVGGGTYHPETNTWSQGAFNTDDMTRAAVVYLRHWQSTGDSSSRRAAFHMLRGVAYMQTVSGPNAGNVVLWMQPDGTLNRSAEPVELPDPSDSAESYWLARTIWALGEGYAAFRKQNPAFASFLRNRLELAIDAVDRQALDRYGEYLRIDGQRTPAWLIVDGADATAEAVLGLSAYVEVGGSRQARTVLRKLSEGVAALSGGGKRTWPFGSVRPWALSRSVWHAWGSQMPAALAEASVVLGDRGLAAPARRDSFTFDPWLLTSGGADQGRLPTRGDRSQIAYGTDSRVQSLIATANATGRDGARRLAGIFAAWYFGANQADEAMYDASNGRTFDGISAEGEINRNSGAESTIHGLLSMIALDQNPDIATLSRTASIDRRVGTRELQAEDASLRRTARVVEPDSLWTGESLFGGSGYVELGRGGAVSFDLGRARRSLVVPVFELEPGSEAVTKFRARGGRLGAVRSGDIGRQGDSPAPGALLPVTLRKTLPGGSSRVTAITNRARPEAPAKLDALMLEPLVSRLVLSGMNNGTALLSSASERRQRARVTVAGVGLARVESYDGRGRLVGVRLEAGRTVAVTVPAGGFTFVRR